MKLTIHQKDPSGKTEIDLSLEDNNTIKRTIEEWEASLPKEITMCIESVIVKPRKASELLRNQVVIIVFLQGFYIRYSDCERTTEKKSWKNKFELLLPNSAKGSELLEDGGVYLRRELTNHLRRAISAQIKTYQPLISELSWMFESLSVRY